MQQLRNFGNEDDLMDIEIYEPATFESQTRPLHKVAKKLKYKDKGYRIEKSKAGGKWSLVKYYRNDFEMRESYGSLGAREISDGFQYRMISPDAGIPA